MTKITTDTIRYDNRDARFFEMLGMIVSQPDFAERCPYFKDAEGKAWTFAFVDGELAGFAGVVKIAKGVEFSNLFIIDGFDAGAVELALIDARIEENADAGLIRVVTKEAGMQRYLDRGFKKVAMRGKQYHVVELKAQK